MNPSDLLKQLEDILDSDTLIDEVGFIHPSQFAALSEEAGNQSTNGTMSSKELNIDSSNLVFWSRDHKLGISTSVLSPLYGAAKHAFMAALKQHKMHDALSRESNNSEDENASKCALSSLSILETKAMKHSKALVLLSCDFGTAWNFRKIVVSKKQQCQLFTEELLLSALVLSYSPKSECAWNHRRWAIRRMAGMSSNLQHTIQRESEFVEKLAEQSKMNYRAWNHRCWLVSYMSGEQVLHELNKSRDWAGLHVADNSCFHYRARLMLKILDFAVQKHQSDLCSGSELLEMWKKELDWVDTLIRRYVGREALWLHRRFLSLCWIKHFANEFNSNSCNTCPKDIMNMEIFLDKELQLCCSFWNVPDNDFEDYQAQATFSANYIVWLIRQVSGPVATGLQQKLEANGVKTVLNNFCPERSFLWDNLTANMLRRTTRTSEFNSNIH